MLEEASNPAKLRAIEQKYRLVIRLAHDIPFASRHLGREEIAQRILSRRKGRDNANGDALSRLDSTAHFVPEKEGGI